MDDQVKNYKLQKNLFSRLNSVIPSSTSCQGRRFWLADTLRGVFLCEALRPPRQPAWVRLHLKLQPVGTRSPYLRRATSSSFRLHHPIRSLAAEASAVHCRLCFPYTYYTILILKGLQIPQLVCNLVVPFSLTWVFESSVDFASLVVGQFLENIVFFQYLRRYKIASLPDADVCWGVVVSWMTEIGQIQSIVNESKEDAKYLCKFELIDLLLLFELLFLVLTDFRAACFCLYR